MCNSRTKILAKCIAGEHLVKPFIELDGTFLPCCWLSTDAKRVQALKDLYGRDYKKLNVKENDVDSIIELWNRISNTWEHNPFKTCQVMCGKE
jgi:hypothetical protein